MGLNPTVGPEFVTVYIDDVLIFSKSLEEHITHLEFVTKAVFSFDSSLIRICQYPDAKSTREKYFACPS